MVRLLTRRVLLSALLVVIVPSLTFFFEAISPGNIAAMLLGPSATPAQLRALSRQLGTNAPLSTQYLHWLGGFVTGNLGTADLTHERVSAIAGQALPVSLSIMIGSIVFATVVGVFLGVFSAIGSGRLGLVTKVVDVGSVGGIAFPPFLIAIALILLVAVEFRLLPAVGYVSITTSLVGWLRSMILPWIALGLGMATYIARQTRDQMLSAMSKDFIRSLRANGVPARSIVFRHALRNASIPVVTLLGLVFIGALTGSVFIEQTFDLPGLGSVLVQAAMTHDLPLVAGVSAVFTVMVVVINFAVDLAYAGLDPRVRSSR